jgi:glycosyltransferase involved in cell wall biosynthesis
VVNVVVVPNPKPLSNPTNLNDQESSTLVPSITALLPAYNERLQGSVVLRTKQYADRRSRDDGSSDRAVQVAALDRAEVLRHVENQGKGAALKTGHAEKG